MSSSWIYLIYCNSSKNCQIRDSKVQTPHGPTVDSTTDLSDSPDFHKNIQSL